MIEVTFKKKFYLVGIDGTKTPDPQYWFDRWEVVEATSIKEAKEVWCAKRQGWIADAEKPFARVWYESNVHFSELAWMRNNVEWFGSHEAKITVEYIG